MKSRFPAFSIKVTCRRNGFGMLWVICFLVLTNCKKEDLTPTKPPAPEPTSTDKEVPPPPVVATFGDNEVITISEVDESIINAPVQRRTPAEAPFSNWYKTWVRDIFFSRVLDKEVAESSIERTPAFTEQARSLKRNLYSEYRLKIALAKLKPISEEDLLKRYEETKEDWKTPENRHIYHIFLRFGDTPETSKEAVISRLNALRERVLKGENFGLLASKYSESETRHKNGSLGSVVRGELNEAAEKVIFSLDEGEVSEPVVINDGAHLFFNENTTVAKAPSFEEVRPEIQQRLNFERSKATLSELAEKCEILGSSFFPDKDELRKLQREGKSDTVILALGTFELTSREFRSLIAGYRKQIRSHNDILGADAPEFLYEEIKNREILFQDMLADTKTDYSEVEAVYEEQRRVLLIKLLLKQKMVGWLEEHQELLREFFKNNENRFQSPGQVHLEGIRIPIPKDADQIMAQLESGKRDLDSGNKTLDEVAGMVDAKVEDWGWFGPDNLKIFDFKAFRIAFGMKSGEHSAPYTFNNTMRIFRLVESETPSPVSFNRAHARVTEMYLNVNGQKVLNAVRKQFEEEYNFRVFQSNFPSPTSIIESDTANDSKPE